MNKSRFLALSFLMALSGFGTAYAQGPALQAGTYKLAIGSKAACELNVTAEGAVTQAADCPTTSVITKAVAVGTSVKLVTQNGDLFGVVKPKGDNFEGFTVSDQPALVLSH